MRKLREADRLLAEGAELQDVCRHLEISIQTYQRWRSQYKAMRPEDVVRLKQLEKENARLKRMRGRAGARSRHAAGGGSGKLLSPERRRRAVVAPADVVSGVSERQSLSGGEAASLVAALPARTVCRRRGAAAAAPALVRPAASALRLPAYPRAPLAARAGRATASGCSGCGATKASLPIKPRRRRISTCAIEPFGGCLGARAFRTACCACWRSRRCIAIRCMSPSDRALGLPRSDGATEAAVWHVEGAASAARLPHSAHRSREEGCVVGRRPP